jgi:hypothetical protein
MVSDRAIYSGQMVCSLIGERLRRSILEPRTCNVFLSISDEEAWETISPSRLQDTT